MIENGFYIIKDSFFERFTDPYLRTNKMENRPHFFALEDNKTGLIWMIPMSSRVSKYRFILDSRIRTNKPCDILHIAKLDNGKEGVFLIQDMFRVTEQYIRRPYTINGVPMRVTSEALVKRVRTKAMRVLTLRRNGVRFSPTMPDVLRIEAELLLDRK